jgi:hypothetical protein
MFEMNIEKRSWNLLVNFDALNQIMESYIPANFIKSTLEKLADSPERLVGILHANSFELGSITSFGISRNNSFGNALEKIFRKIVENNGWDSKITSYKLSDHEIIISGKTSISVDHVFCKGGTVVFIEQKIRDDHDTSKWSGQWNNFKDKLESLVKIYSDKEVVGVMWMIDSSLTRNKENYKRSIESLTDNYQNKALLVYGNEIDDVFNKFEDTKGEYYNLLYSFIEQWYEKNEIIPNDKIPEVNFDKYPDEVLKVFNSMSKKKLLKLFSNEVVIKEVFPVIFPNKQAIKVYRSLILAKPQNNRQEKENAVLPLLDLIIEQQR